MADSNIEQLLKQILGTKLGKDMRQAIHDGIEQCYEDGKVGAVDLVARQRIDNLSKLEPGSTTGDAELRDIRIGYDGTEYETAGEAVRGQIGSLSEEISEISNIVGGVVSVVPSEVADEHYVADVYGKLVAKVSADYQSGGLIDISNFVTGTKIRTKASLLSNYGVFIADNDMKVLDYINGNNAVEKGYSVTSKPQDVALYVPQNAKYIVSDIRTAYIIGKNDFTVHGVANNLKPVLDDMSDKIDDIEKKAIVADFVIGKNMYNPNSDENEYGFVNSDGSILGINKTTYITSPFIPVFVGNKYAISHRARKFLAYDNEKNPLPNTYEVDTITDYIFTPSQDGYIRATFWTEDNVKQIEKSDIVTTFEEYYEQKVPTDDIHMSDTMLSDNGNILFGKKWVACGDSFTEGSFNASLTDDYLFTDGKYKGKNKVYPYWIGSRNKGLEVVNEAISGSTMTGGSSGINGFSVDRYKKIPSDADYITMRFGINDSGHNCPLGTIDDATNETFYGSWNVVLDYLTTNFPFAHIGIIVGEGMQTIQGQEYAIAEIEIAKKWGIPYLNIQFESGGEKIPLTFRTSNPNVLPSQVQKKFNAFAVNPSTSTPNHHPNEKAHEYESHFIEAWLRTI